MQEDLQRRQCRTEATSDPCTRWATAGHCNLIANDGVFFIIVESNSSHRYLPLSPITFLFHMIISIAVHHKTFGRFEEENRLWFGL